MRRYLLSTEIDESTVATAFTDGASAVFAPQEKLIVTYLDTFDWRLHRAGLVLMEERGRRRTLVLLERGREPYVIPAKATPRTAEDLPPGYLADTIAPLLDIRALTPLGTAGVLRREGRIEDDDGNMIARLRFEHAAFYSVTDDCEGSVVNSIRISGPNPERRLALPDIEELPSHDLEAVAALRGRIPDDYSSKLIIALSAEQAADNAMRTILLELLTTLEANVQGTIADIDSEFLHDLRVACRRTRSALTQLKGVLDPDAISPFKTEFKWLGDVTGPQRDLDVYLLEMPTYRAMLPDEVAADLDPLVKLIRTDRAKAHRSVARALRSTRFRQLTKSWRECLDSIGAAPTKTAAGSTAQLAAKRISRAYRRILKKGSGFGGDPPAEALHRLRIDAKKLRYLLEFFRSLYPRREITARIKELKHLQDILGGFNDMEVQRDRLAVFAEDLHADPLVGAGAILTLGRLAGTLEQRQESFRLAFHEAFVEFSSAKVRAAYGRLFGGKESG